jgi:hypothetical protein
LPHQLDLKREKQIRN